MQYNTAMRAHDRRDSNWGFRGSPGLGGDTFQYRESWLSCAGRIKATSTKRLGEHSTPTPSCLTPSSQLIVAVPCCLPASHSDQAEASTGPKGTKAALPQGPPSTSYPVRLRAHTSSNAAFPTLPPTKHLIWGTASPKGRLRFSNKCPIPQSQDHRAE